MGFVILWRVGQKPVVDKWVDGTWGISMFWGQLITGGWIITGREDGSRKSAPGTLYVTLGYKYEGSEKVSHMKVWASRVLVRGKRKRKAWSEITVGIVRDKAEESTSPMWRLAKENIWVEENNSFSFGWYGRDYEGLLMTEIQIKKGFSLCSHMGKGTN